MSDLSVTVITTFFGIVIGFVMGVAIGVNSPYREVREAKIVAINSDKESKGLVDVVLQDSGGNFINTKSTMAISNYPLNKTFKWVVVSDSAYYILSPADK